MEVEKDGGGEGGEKMNEKSVIKLRTEQTSWGRAGPS